VNYFRRQSRNILQFGAFRELNRSRAGLGRFSDSAIAKQVTELREQLSSPSRKTKRLNSRDAAKIVALGEEAVRRVLGFRLHNVQLAAVFNAAAGTAIEMQTGEGKTVVSAMIAFVQSCLKSNVHLATTNAYLAERDFNQLHPVFERLGISTALISHGQDQQAKRAAYRADVTFGPGYQFGFDYLADQVVLRHQQTGRLGASTLSFIDGFDIESLLLQPGHFGTMIVDEADSIMIDEALTPLILSGANDTHESLEPYQYARQFAERMTPGIDYIVSPNAKRIELTRATVETLHQDFLNQPNRMQLTRPWQRYIENAIHALHFLERNEHYVVQDGEIKIVDQFTGRIFDDRQWQDGLHQAVQAKENVQIQGGNVVQAQISRQRYFMLYEKLIGLSGTLRGTEKELRSVYRLPVISIPTHLPSKRSVLPTRFFESMESRLEAIQRDVKTRHEGGQPVLIGTRTIRQSLLVQEALQAAGMNPVVLNGIQDRAEAEIVAQAGQSGALTIATNMAGRGTDIKLAKDAKNRGGLHVIGYEHNPSRRVDRQLIGRCARQGEPGSSQFYASAVDEMIVVHGRGLSARMQKAARKNGECPIDSFSSDVRTIQRAEEVKALVARQQLMRSVNWLDQIRNSLANDKAAG
jgi:preprotein translocase subunit SecA